MKPTFSSPLPVCFGLTLALAMFVSFQTARADEPAKKGMIQSCEKMKDGKQTLIDEMEAQDAALAAAVVKMNAATSEEKSVQLAAIVTTLVEQKTALRVGMVALHSQTVAHMMEHMQNGKDSMMSCPMMKDTDDRPAGSRKARH